MSCILCDRGAVIGVGRGLCLPCLTLNIFALAIGTAGGWEIGLVIAAVLG